MRKYYLDNIRWITVCIVVIYHVIYMYNGVQPFGVIGPFRKVQYQDAFQYLTYPWFMALLFVVSGMSARYYLEGHTDKEFKRARTRKLLIPSTVGVVVFHWSLGIYNTAISNAFTQELSQVPGFVKALICILSGIGPLWYIQMLWIFSMLLLLLRKIEKDRLWRMGAKANIVFLLLFSVIIWGSAQILNTPMVTVYRFGIYSVSFFMGYFVMSHEEVTDRLMKYWFPLAVIAAALGVVYTVLYFGENYAVEPFINNIWAMMFCWFAILAILANMKKWCHQRTKFGSWMNQKSWGLYILHYLPLAMTAYYLKVYAPAAPPIVCYVLVTIAAFVGAFVLYEIISRIPILKYLVLGIK